MCNVSSVNITDHMMKFISFSIPLFFLGGKACIRSSYVGRMPPLKLSLGFLFAVGGEGMSVSFADGDSIGLFPANSE